jgi:hypothetical protein
MDDASPFARFADPFGKIKSFAHSGSSPGAAFDCAEEFVMGYAAYLRASTRSADMAQSELTRLERALEAALEPNTCSDNLERAVFREALDALRMFRR